MAIYFPYNFNGGSSGSESNIQVFKSTDFEPLTYTSGNTTYYCPRITFPGNANGKILGIKAIDADGRFRSFEPSKLLHFGSNILEPITVNIHNATGYRHVCGTTTQNGITVTYLGNGGYRVRGTSGTNSSYNNVRIGSVWFDFINSDCNINNINARLACDVRGEGNFEGLKLGNSGTHANNKYIELPNHINSWVVSSQFSNHCDVFLTWGNNETYDCIIYPKITILDNSYYNTSVREMPFVGRSITGIVQEKYGFSSQFSTASASGSGSHSHAVTSDIRTGNASNFGIVDYPIVHTGLNNFVYTKGFTDLNNILYFEIYYDPSYYSQHSNTIEENIDEIKNSISYGRIDKPIYVYGGMNTETYDTKLDKHYLWFPSTYFINIAPRSPYMPKGIYLWWSFSSSSGSSAVSSRYMGDTLTYYDSVNWLQSQSFFGSSRSGTIEYVPSSNFSFNNQIMWGKDGDSYYSIPLIDTTGIFYSDTSTFTSTNSYYSRIIFDYEGFDDTVTYEAEDGEVGE